VSNTLPARIFIVTVTVVLAGCKCGKINPSFPLTISDAKAELADISEDPKPLERPLVCITGWLDLGAKKVLDKHLARTIDDDRVLVIRIDDTKTMATARDRVMDAAMERFPSDDPAWTAEVDVIGFSMGGLVARSLADPATGDRHLRIARLYTVSTPHLGAIMAGGAVFSSQSRDMIPGSTFLTYLNNEVEIDYELVPYGRLCDTMVGVRNTAPPGYTPWWVSAPAFQDSHINAIGDPRILADITLRLRGETPATISPPAPVP
jgi:pimeloyl-ACP methyl ester carboxylesterase